MATEAEPTPASVSLPLSFANSFWSAEPRRGFELLYDRLESSCTESDEILATVRRRAEAENALASILQPPALRKDGFAADEGASLRAGYEAVLTLNVSEARARTKLAADLETSIATPFEEWSKAHAGRISSSRALIESHLAPYEKGVQQLNRFKAQYDEACRHADALEDEFKFTQSRSPNPSAATATTAPSIEPKSEAETEKLSILTKEEKGKGKEENAGEPNKAADEVDTDDEKPAVIGFAKGLGRAFTVRRKQAQEKLAAAPISPVLADPNVAVALDWSKNTFSSLIERVAGPQTGEGKLEKATKAAEEAETKYKSAVESVENFRCSLQEALGEHFQYVHRCEQDRLKAASSVLKSFHLAVAALNQTLLGLHERVGTALDLVRPEKDISAIIERLRTGPFTPRALIFQSHYAEPAKVYFGIDLRKFQETNSDTNSPIPPILPFLLNYIQNAYSSVSSDSEKRKLWLYETPLSAQHHLRAMLNSTRNEFSAERVAEYDLPVVCSVVKLWLMELNVPVVPFSHYSELHALYPKRVGAEAVEKIRSPKAVADFVARLPEIHLEVLRAVISHFSNLMQTTQTDEPEQVYLQKLSLSMARCILRPNEETALTLSDRFPALFFADLVKSYQEIFTAADELKSKERLDRYKPRRQRTRPTDQRISRSSLGAAAHESIDLGKSHALLRESFTSPKKSEQTAENSESTDSESAIMREKVAELPSETPVTQETGTINSQGAVQEVASAPSAIEAEDQPIQKASSLSRSIRLRGARGPRPKSGVPMNAGQAQEEI